MISNDEHDVMEFSDIEPGNKVDKVIREVNAQVKGVLLQYDLDDGKFVGDPEYKCEICHPLFDIRYLCDWCDYTATRKDHLKLHKDSIHEGVRYSCDTCDYKATTKDNLKKHKDSIHEDVKYSCDHCVYTTSWKTLLLQHRKNKH